jgi:hypothetical protein
VTHTTERRVVARFVRKLSENAGHDRLDGAEHVLLRDEGEPDVELIKLAGGTVGARVFIAETGRDLKIPVDPGHHQELFEDLGACGKA